MEENQDAAGWSETAKSTGYFSCGLMCIFSFFKEYPVRAWM